jgi:hypothetical protein
VTDPNLRTLRNDDRLLDRIGRGEQVNDGDVEAMLGAWRDTLPVAGPPGPRLVAAVTAPRPRPRRRVARTSLGVAASVALLAGGVMVGAAYVNPDSPLWPVTGFVYGDITDSQAPLDEANRDVADARTAVEHGRYAEAARLLGTADELAGRVDDPGAAKRLRDDIADVRAELPPDPRTKSGATTVHRPAASIEAPPAPPDGAAPGGTQPEHESDHDHHHGPGRDIDHDYDEHDDHDGPGFGDDRDHGEEHGHEMPRGKANKPRPHNALPGFGR